MPGKEILPYDCPREMWLERRRQGIGASEIAAVMGLSPYETPLSVWLVKSGRATGFQGNKRSEWGAWKEDLICRWFAEETGKAIRPAGLWQSTEYRWQLATPDRIVFHPNNELLETKAVGHRVLHHWDRGVPPYYYPQGQQQLDTTGLDVCHFAAELGGNPPTIFTIHRDHKFIDAMHEAGNRMWWHIETDTQPPHQNPYTAEELEALYPTTKGTQLELGFDALIDHATYTTTRRVEKDAETAKKEAGLRLRQHLGTHHTGLIDGQPAITITANGNLRVI
jgi:putative phage-type endonuclease